MIYTFTDISHLYIFKTAHTIRNKFIVGLPLFKYDVIAFITRADAALTLKLFSKERAIRVRNWINYFLCQGLIRDSIIYYILSTVRDSLSIIKKKKIKRGKKWLSPLIIYPRDILNDKNSCLIYTYILWRRNHHDSSLCV